MDHMKAGAALCAALCSTLFVPTPALRCYQQENMASIINRTQHAHFTDVPKWPSVVDYPAGHAAVDCGEGSANMLFGQSDFCLKLVRKNATSEELATQATGSCYRSLLVLSGVQCDANGKTGTALVQGRNDSYTYHCCDSDLCNSSPRVGLVVSSRMICFSLAIALLLALSNPSWAI